MELKGSKTEANLMAAFAGESQARNKYTYYASKARKEGYNQIADLFEETARNEQEHAKIWFKLLHEGEVPDTKTNLKDAADGENWHGQDRTRRRLHQNRRSLRIGGQNREGTRGTLPQASEKHRGRPGLLSRRRHGVAMR